MVLGYSLASITSLSESDREVENGYTFNIDKDMIFAIESEAGIFGYTVEFKFENLDGTYTKNASLMPDDTSLSGAVDSTIGYSDIYGVIAEVDGYTYQDYTTGLKVKALPGKDA